LGHGLELQAQVVRWSTLAERGKGYVYELLYNGDGSRALHLFELLDAAALGGYDGERSGRKASRSVAGRAEVGAGRRGYWRPHAHI